MAADQAFGAGPSGAPPVDFFGSYSGPPNLNGTIPPVDFSGPQNGAVPDDRATEALQGQPHATLAEQ